ncbi:MAG: transglutaminase domain-containing protein [Anaerolineae bacterium]|nr:transglutaminase domain-containing protein [Anaerolineae bacterium]
MAANPEGKQDLQGQLTYLNLLAKGFLSVGKLLLFDFKDVKRFRKTSPLERHYVRPPRRYEIPEYSPDMRHCTSNEKFLHPTRHCNCRAPDVIAIAHSLGAYQVSDLEFTQAAFEFAKEKMTLEIAPIVGVEEILQRGTGTCFELITVFIALCRAAGIKARYKIFATHMIQAWRNGTIDADPLLNKWYDSLGYFLLEGEGEAYVDGKWMVAHVGPTAERQASAGIPITRLGEDALGIWFTARPGSIMLLESLPAGLAAGSRILHKISPGTMERVNVSVLNENEKGREIIENAGGVQAYDQRVRAELLKQSSNSKNQS